MRVGIEYLLPGTKDTGVEYAIREMTEALLSAGGSNSYILLGCNDTALENFPAATTIQRVTRRNRGKRILWQQLIAPISLMRANIDVYHATGYVVSPRIGVPTVVSVYDTIALDNACYTSLCNAAHFECFVPRGLRRASVILVPTNVVKERLVTVVGVSPENVIVMPLGISTRFKPSSLVTSPVAANREGFDARGGEYLLAVGTQERKKNYLGLLSAFLQVRARYGSGIRLVIVGKEGNESRAIRKFVNAHALQDTVSLLGYVGESDLPRLYREAAALVYPSWVEGFGFPPLEAMACGAPVVCSDIPVLREVCGEAVRFVAPGDPASIADGIVEVLTRPGFRQDLARRGAKRAARYSWTDYAESLTAIYEYAACGARCSDAQPSDMSIR